MYYSTVWYHKNSIRNTWMDLVIHNRFGRSDSEKQDPMTQIDNTNCIQIRSGYERQ